MSTNTRKDHPKRWMMVAASKKRKAQEPMKVLVVYTGNKNSQRLAMAYDE